MLSKRLSVFLFWFYYALMLYLSLSKGVGDLDLSRHKVASFRLDYLFHVGAYLSFFAGYLILLRWGYLPFQKYPLLKTVVVVSMLAVGTEFLQKLTPNRAFNFLDMASNGIGILIGVFCVLVIRKHWISPDR